MDGLPPLIDQYSLGAVHDELGLGSFETHLAAAAGAYGPAPAGTSYFDSFTGLAIRRWCPPLLGLEPHCPPARYLARRREVGAFRAGRMLLRGSGIGTFLLEAGTPSNLTSATELATAAAGRTHEVVRLEPLAEQVADTSGGRRSSPRCTPMCTRMPGPVPRRRWARHRSASCCSPRAPGGCPSSM